MEAIGLPSDCIADPEPDAIMPEKHASLRNFKKKSIEMLEQPDIEPALEEFSHVSPRRVIHSLFPLLCHQNPVIKWRAVTAMGDAVSRLIKEDMEAVREIVRRLMWNLNDESGGIGWGAPEAMGEILSSSRKLAKEYAPILLSYAREDGNFQEHPLMQRGVLWGIGRVAQANPDLFKGGGDHLIPYLYSADSTVRGLAARAAGLIAVKEARERLELLKTDDSPIQVYLDGRLIHCRVMDLAEEALLRLEREDGDEH